MSSSIFSVSGSRALRFVLAGVTSCFGLGAAIAAPGASAASGSAFCSEAKTELAKLGAIAQNFTTSISSKVSPGVLKAQLEPFIKAYNETSSKLQKDAPSNLRASVKVYLDQGVKGLTALEKAGWDIKRLPQQIADPPNFATAIAPLVAYARTTCGVELTPLSQLSATSSSAASTKASKSTGKHADPVQLTMAACSLYTKAEAEKLVGVPMVKLEPGINGDTLCTYNAVKVGQGQLNVSLQSPSGCKLLILALDSNIFGGKQVRVDGIGNGGMLVKGNGNVQFTTHGGCIGVSARSAAGSLPDDVMLSLAKLVETRVKG